MRVDGAQVPWLLFNTTLQKREGKISAWKAVPLHELLPSNKHSLFLLYGVRLSGHLEKKAGFGEKRSRLAFRRGP